MHDPQRAWMRLAAWARQSPSEADPGPSREFVLRVLAGRRLIGPPEDRVVFESLAMRVAIAATLLVGVTLLLWGIPSEADATPFASSALVEGTP